MSVRPVPAFQFRQHTVPIAQKVSGRGERDKGGERNEQNQGSRDPDALTPAPEREWKRAHPGADLTADGGKQTGGRQIARRAPGSARADRTESPRPTTDWAARPAAEGVAPGRWRRRWRVRHMWSGTECQLFARFSFSGDARRFQLRGH